MTVREFGTGDTETVVLLHGGGLSWWNYRGEIELLKSRYHIIVPELDGHAGSDADFTSIEDNAARIIGFIDERFGGQVRLIGGLSLGGQILLEILSRRGDICKFAMIESALALPMPVTRAMIGPAMLLSYGLIRKKWFSRLQMKSLNLPGDRFEDYYRDTCAITGENYTRFMKSNSSYRAKPGLSLCRAKTLVLVGGRERPVMKKSAKLIGDLIPNSEIITVKDAHHGDLSINNAERYVAYMEILMR